MDEPRRDPAHTHHIVGHVVIGDVWRYHIVAGRVVVQPKPTYPRKKRVKDSLVNMVLDVGQIHKGRAGPLKQRRHIVAALVLDDEKLFGVSKSNRRDDLANHRVEARDPHYILGVQVAYTLVELEVVEIGEPLPLAQPIAVEAVQHLPFALPEYQLLLIHYYPAYLYFGSSSANKSRSRCPSPWGPSCLLRGRYT